MGKHLYILTGASRGMGLAMAGQLLQPGHLLLCISRHANETLAAQAQARGASLLQWQADLADGVAVAHRLQDWLDAQSPAELASATLINNAGVIPQIEPLSQADDSEVDHALRVGLEAPMQRTPALLGTAESSGEPP